ncbi:MAG: heat-inducible transcriptional repressor HrcA [Acidobacteriota bacterium]|nr:heat-inducible transcriptional repressor HrcA [Acidobacteriota bacterium]
MPAAAPGPGECPRSQETLRIVVREHVRTGQPVSSSQVARLHPEKLSPASIRNLMAGLSEAGLLSQPYTSAGRVPTDLGYRRVVDEVLKRRRRKVAVQDARKIQAVMESSQEIEEVLARAGRLLADLSQQVGMVLAPDLEQAILEYIEFVRVAPRRIVAIFVSRSGIVSHRVVEVDEDLPQEELDRLSVGLREQFAGLSFPEMRQRMMEALREDERWARRLGRSVTGSVIALLEEPFPEESGGIIVEGASRLLDAPEFTDVERLRDVLRALEERTTLLRLIERCLKAPGVQVIIGRESMEPELSEVSFVGRRYCAGGSMRGLVGVIGPRRMEYARAVALVDHFARTLSRALGGSEGGDES